MSNVVHYLDGSWVEEAALVVPVKDLSVSRGFGVFDYLRTYNHKPFRLADHIDRFCSSAAMLGLELAIEKDELSSIVDKGLETNPDGEYGIRMILTGGTSEDFITQSKPTLIVGFFDLHTPTAEQYANGVKVVTTAHIRHLPEAKSLNYLTAVMAQREAKQHGAVEAIYVDADTSNIFEGTSSNFFAVRNGIVITPDQDVLKGVTRQVVFELCQQLGIECRENNLSLNSIGEYSEMFITSSNREVLPVVQIDDLTIGDGNVGTVSKRLKEAFNSIAH